MNTNISAEFYRQLSLLDYQDGDDVFIRGFYPSDHPRSRSDLGVKNSFTFTGSKDCIPADILNLWQQNERGVYFVVNGQGHKAADISFARAIFYEHDQVDAELSCRIWQALSLPEPTFQVHTGGKSIHSYWTFSEKVDIDPWKEFIGGKAAPNS